MTFAKASGNKKISISSAGKFTIKKGTKKGYYKIKVNVKAAGDANHNAATRPVTVTIKIK